MRCVVLLVVGLLLFVHHLSLADKDIDLIRQRILQTIMWPSAGNIPNVVRAALMYAQNLNSSCYWPDIDYYDRSRAIWSPSQHMARVSVMVQALTVNGSSVYNSTSLETSIHCALNVWLTNDWQCPNWWFNEINIPLSVAGQLLMLADRATSFEIEKMKEITYRSAWWLHRDTDVGANLINMLQVQVYRSLATNNVTGVDQGFARMWQDIQVVSLGEQGIQNDWSYHFHGLQLLSGSYGIVWLDGILSFIVISEGTRVEIDEEQMVVLANFLTQGDAWMIIGHEWDWNVVGRSIARPTSGFGPGFSTDPIRYLAQQIADADLRSKLNEFVDRLERKPNATLLLGNRHFYTSDYQAHRRANWSSTIKMQSIRTQATECTNGENIKDEHGGQGVLNLYKNVDQDYQSIFPLLDWQAINGITVEHGIPLEPCESSGFQEMKLPFVGGVSDGQYGLAMMDTITHNLTARRSWHFYDDFIFALMTNLTLSTSNTAWTTLASRVQPRGNLTVGFYNGTTVTLTDGIYSFPYTDNQSSRLQWIHVGNSNIGYLLQESSRSYSSIGIELQNKNGSYSSIGVHNDSVTARTLTIWMDHGLGPFRLDSTYLIFPDVTLSAFPSLIAEYANEQVYSCQSTHPDFHGTIWPNLKRASFVLWENVTTNFSCQTPLFQLHLQLQDAGAYLFRENETDFTFTASHPTRTRRSINVKVDRYGQGDNCVASIMNNETNVTLLLPSSSELAGGSVQTTCKKVHSLFLH